MRFQSTRKNYKIAATFASKVEVFAPKDQHFNQHFLKDYIMVDSFELWNWGDINTALKSWNKILH